MMNIDVNPTESIFQATQEERFNDLVDPKMNRDAQMDLHTAIDLMFEFAKQIKGLHPLASKQVKTMILQGAVL